MGQHILRTLVHTVFLFRPMVSVDGSVLQRSLRREDALTLANVIGNLLVYLSWFEPSEKEVKTLGVAIALKDVLK